MIGSVQQKIMGIVRRAFATIFVIIVLVTPAFAGSSYENGDVVVCITRTGECYHRDGCSYLKSRIEVTLEQAVNRGYRACSRCKPPRLGDLKESDTDPYIKKGNNTYSGNSYVSVSTPRPTATPKPTPKPTPTPEPIGKKIVETGFAILLGGWWIILPIASVVVDSVRGRQNKKITYKAPVSSSVSLPSNNGQQTNTQTQVIKIQYVYISPNGHAYHKTRGCSRAYMQIDKNTAIARGYRPCKVCVLGYPRPYYKSRRRY